MESTALATWIQPIIYDRRRRPYIPTSRDPQIMITNRACVCVETLSGGYAKLIETADEKEVAAVLAQRKQLRSALETAAQDYEVFIENCVNTAQVSR